tara:strand:- start:253 stop:465 length:213 start_codon:yes stop_codon:yes gene_type:complete
MIRDNNQAMQEQVDEVVEAFGGLLTCSDWLARQSDDVQLLLNNCNLDDDNNNDESGFVVTFRFNYIKEAS